MPLYKDDPKALGGYRIVDRLGSGGMGVVYRARSRSGREVAVKVVHAQYAEDAVFRARFRQEIEAARKVSGAFTAPVVDADPEAVRPWMATQYVPAPSLAERIRATGPLKGLELRRLALGLVEALREIHRAGVVHRDLKPANVLMAEDGPRVIDFGISRAAENQTLTETGHAIGTPPFMSPEQFTDARSVGPASDVFSLGALLVFAATGHGPFDADSPYMTAYRVLHEEPALDAVADPLRSLLTRCLAKEAGDRPGLDELAREFSAALPEPTGGDMETVTLRLPPSRAVDLGPTALAPSSAFAGRRSRVRGLAVPAGTAGVLAVALTVYLLLGPLKNHFTEEAGSSANPSASSRSGTLPAGWRPWQTTLYENAERGVVKPPADRSGDDSPGCTIAEGALYCGGDGLLPTRLDGRTGRTLWRAGLAPDKVPMDRYVSGVVGVRDGVVVVQQVIHDDSGETEKSSVIGLDSATGTTLWSHTVNLDYLEAVFASGTVLIPDAESRSLTARSALDGTVRWKTPLPGKHSCALFVMEDRPFVECLTDDLDSEATEFLVVDHADGSVQRLTSPAASSSFVGPLDGRLVFVEWDMGAMEASGDTVYTRVVRVDPDSGKRSVTKLAERYLGRVTLRHGTLYFATSGGRVTAASPLTGEQLWETRTTLESPSEAVTDDTGRTVFVVNGSGRVSALDASRGTLLWESTARAEVLGSGYLSPVLFNEGALVVTTPDGTVFTLDPGHPDRKPVTA